MVCIKYVNKSYIKPANETDFRQMKVSIKNYNVITWNKYLWGPEVRRHITVNEAQNCDMRHIT